MGIALDAIARGTATGLIHPQFRAGAVPRWWQCVAVGLVCVYAVLAWSSGLDRASAEHLHWTRAIPPDLRAQTEAALVRRLLQNGRVDLAEAHVQRAVLRDPFAAAPAALLGTVRLIGGNEAGAQQAFAVAAQFGWREPLTQAYWLDRALEQEDWTRAAARTDAMLRALPDHGASAIMLSRLEQDPRGQAVLAKRLMLGPDWREAFLQPDSTISTRTLEQRAAIMAQMAAAGGVVGCGAAAPFAERLVIADRLALAQSIWAAHCAGPAALLPLRDGSFDRFARFGDGDPLGWRAMHHGDIAVQRSGRDGAGEVRMAIAQTGAPTGAVLVTSEAGTARPILKQHVALPSGTVRIRWIATEDGRRSRRIGVALDCGVPQRRSVMDDIGTMRVPSCPSQVLSIWLSPGNAAVRLHHIQLDKMPDS
ncbi:hypothetical protein RM533_06000 [Croceicoccus sp. F390]|uniref:Tetratricopeptide repeat protein n=1 Tax=Croceicoccus esteveae TaxID=3075597 RepID=A0ABU2ZI76_9SPHN|nr:hypothetical protein [Croceicoccus sp. F390]MDT0575733.1 hypothetical protein [Croceicoccus sp. F390]